MVGRDACPFASAQGAGHFGPLIPFIEAAIRQGHDVLAHNSYRDAARRIAAELEALPSTDEALALIQG